MLLCGNCVGLCTLLPAYAVVDLVTVGIGDPRNEGFSACKAHENMIRLDVLQFKRAGSLWGSATATVPLVTGRTDSERQLGAFWSLARPSP
jgi:hypothetical protein